MGCRDQMPAHTVLPLKAASWTTDGHELQLVLPPLAIGPRPPYSPLPSTPNPPDDSTLTPLLYPPHTITATVITPFKITIVAGRAAAHVCSRHLPSPPPLVPFHSIPSLPQGTQRPWRRQQHLFMFSLQILGFRNPGVVGGFRAANKQKTLCGVVILNAAVATAATCTATAAVATCTAAPAVFTTTASFTAAAEISPKNRNASCGTKTEKLG